ncbi:MAG: PKD domain-containing protein, partial [Verrucomicrobia bacterium]|nr:PKD domain-containing protein [Verrucomicrobiota bacterium]
YFMGEVVPTRLNNCIVYSNTAPSGPNYYYATLNYCCTTPLPTNGVGNISLYPQLLDAAHLSPSSPCRAAGSADYTTGTDIDGEAWASPPSMGCDEYYPGPATGPLRVTVVATFTTVPTGYTVDLVGLIEGHFSLSVWDFGDGSTLTNRLYTSHVWTVPGDYAVVLRAYNESNPGGVSATATVHVVAQPIYYVAAANAAPAPPYTSWATAATNIQDAVDAADVASFPPGSVLVLVSNGVYRTGGRAVVGTMTNRVVVDKLLTVRSVNGPEFTIVEGRRVPGATNGCGDGAIRCVYLSNGASLSGFTLTNGATRSWTWPYDESQYDGGGLWCESVSAVVSNCVLVGNSACDGGGVYGGTLNNCAFISNSASDHLHYHGYGGAARNATLNNCTLTGNSANAGGGASGWDAACTLNNCILVGNYAEGGGGGADESSLYNCTLIGNSAAIAGGGTIGGVLNNCTLTANSAGDRGGGASYGTLNNCIVYFNTAANGANYYWDEGYGGILNYSCTTPMPTNGVGNITNAPLFVDYANGNLRLQSNSPCINAGNNAYAPGSTDLDGNPRIVRGTVDIGAYEYQGAGSMISYAWLQQYGLPTDGSADYVDSDRDGHNNWQEWRCETDPTNTLSALRLLSATPAGTNVTVTWQSVAGVSYFVERSTNLASPFTPLGTGIPGQSGTTTYTDTSAAGLAPLFYRVGVGN